MGDTCGFLPRCCKWLHQGGSVCACGCACVYMSVSVKECKRRLALGQWGVCPSYPHLPHPNQVHLEARHPVLVYSGCSQKIERLCKNLGLGPVSGQLV